MKTLRGGSSGSRPAWVALVILLAAASVPFLRCTGSDDGNPDAAGCLIDGCWDSCLLIGRPGGECVGDRCVCLTSDGGADADADSDGEVVDTGDDGGDRVEVRDDATEVRDDGGDRVEVRDDAVDIPEDTGPICADAAVGWTFNAGAGSWTHAAVGAPATGTFDPWVVGTPVGGPGGCRGGGTGNQCWTTGLSGEYATCQRAALRSPRLDLSACVGATHAVDLRFWQWHAFGVATGSFDGGTVELTGDGGATWVQVDPVDGWGGAFDLDVTSGSGCEGTMYMDGMDAYVGASGRWVQVTIEVPDALRTDAFAFRFVFGSDAATGGAGWFIDDVAIVPN